VACKKSKKGCVSGDSGGTNQPADDLMDDEEGTHQPGTDQALPHTLTASFTGRCLNFKFVTPFNQEQEAKSSSRFSLP